MCGFAGVISFDPRLAIDRPTLQKMSDAIARRGPDGEGIWLADPTNGPRVALAHRRLAILDPDPRSNQPFTDGRRWLVFNGEIYNFRDLRAQLSPRDWKTTGDTEVLLAAYAKWGEQCVDHLNGMFALAIWDSQDQSLFLARDRMGQKPLYVATAPTAVAFASEILALLPITWVDQSTDSVALMEYLRWGYVPTPQTIYRGIRQISPAQTLLITAAGISTKTYFDPNQAQTPAANIIPTTRQLIRQSVQRQLISDVPLGCFLSGGIDSSIIAAAMKAAVPADQKILTFSIGFDDPRYDETQYAAAVAKHLQTEHRQFIVRPDAAADLPKIAAAFGQPMADSSALPTYYLAQQTRQHVKVALSGDGGDELFGGYDRYRALRLLRLLRAAGRWPWILAAPLVGAFPASHPKSTIARLKRLVDSAALTEAARYSTYMRLMDDNLLNSLLTTPPDQTHPDAIETLFSSFAARGPAESAMAVDRLTYLPDDLLTKVDRCSMLHALEVRSPFMDHDLVTFAAGLNATDLLAGGTKRPLRRAFAADLPQWVFRRKKMGFAVPIGDWLRTSLQPMLQDLLFSADSFAAGHFHRGPLEAMIQEHQTQRRDHSQRLYGLLMLELWWRGR
jgi:asparagine synthase (glutamine-hydrolysing)